MNDVTSKIKSPYFYLTLGIMALFLFVWFICAKQFTGWGDEMVHFSTGKGLVETGQYSQWAFDEGRIIPGTYTRGLVITYLTSLIYKITGLSLLAFRVIPLISVLLTFATFAFYICLRLKASWKAVSFAAIFFFGQAFVFEQSVYVRFYAPLGWLMILSIVFYWEALVAFEKHKGVWGCGFLLASFTALILPTIDHWQVQHVAIYFLGILLTLPQTRSLFGKFNEKFSFKTKVFLGGIIVVAAPLIVFLLDLIMGQLVVDVKHRTMGRTFVTYWDNLAGILRYVLALNVCFLGLGFVVRDLKTSRGWDFYSWLFFTGIISGICIGLFNPHNHIFFSRFFYISVMMSVLGFSQMLLRPEISEKFRYGIIAVFIFFNIGLFMVNAYCERSNIRVPIAWLNKNLKQNDLLLVYASDLGLNGGGSLISRAYVVNPTQDPEKIEELLARILSSESGDVYYLYTDHYEFRDRMYFSTTGQDRSPPSDLFRYVKERIPSQKVILRLRTCGLVKFNKLDLIAGIRKLSVDGFPISFKAPEKRILKEILGMRSFIKVSPK